MSSRSYEPLTLDDLQRLGCIATKDQNLLFERKPELAKLYSNRRFAVALCQGAGLHFIDGKNGVKDLDVWSFYQAVDQRPFPYRRTACCDFGDPKFGKTEDSPDFIGRRVDLLGRSLDVNNISDPISVLRNYLIQRKTETARRLAEKAVVLIEPELLLGTVVWPLNV